MTEAFGSMLFKKWIYILCRGVKQKAKHLNWRGVKIGKIWKKIWTTVKRVTVYYTIEPHLDSPYQHHLFRQLIRGRY